MTTGSAPVASAADYREFSYSDFLKALPDLRKENAAAKPLKVAVLRSYTIEPIEPVLEYRLLREGYAAEFLFGGFNQFVQEALDPSSELYRFGPDIVLLLARAEELMPDFVGAFGRAGFDWMAHVAAKADELAGVAAAIRRNGAAQVLVQNLSAPARPYFGVFDAQMPAGQRACAAEFNRALAGRLSEIGGAFVWDYAGFVERQGHEQLFDPKMFYLSKNPFRQPMLPAMADDIMPYLLSMLGRSKKCVVLDLDNTLWGGVVGEDGIDGIELGHTYPGVCYRAFQENLLKLYHRGVILAINSKNNEADALKVLDEHPDMVLRREHFAAMQINWNDKPGNIRELARALNIGVDSMIMIDDNPAECEFIRGAVPECTVVCLPEKPWLIPAVAEQLPGIDNVRLTDEDRQKGAMYQAQAERKRHEESYANVDEFLASLSLEVTIAKASSFSIPRIAQLTQKTNQLNVTTRRYSEAEISTMAESPDTDVYAVSVRDKFGDNGIVGVLIAIYEGRTCRIDTLLLSCRVIGRNIETAMLAHLADAALARNVDALVGEFIPTAKNGPAAEIFTRAGFTPEGDTGFRLELASGSIDAPSYIAFGT